MGGPPSYPRTRNKGIRCSICVMPPAGAQREHPAKLPDLKMPKKIPPFLEATALYIDSAIRGFQ